MAIALVGSGSAFAGGNADGFTTGSFDTTGADLIVINLGQGNSVTNGVITDSKGNTWTPLNQPATGGKSTRLVYAWNATVGSGHTFTVSGTDNFPALSISWWSGSQTASDPFDQQTAGGTVPFSNTVQPGSVTPGTDNQVVITGLSGDANTAAPTINLGFTVIGTVLDNNAGHQNSALAYEIQTTATARNPTWTAPATGSWAAAIATFKAAAGGGGGGVVRRSRGLTGVGH